MHGLGNAFARGGVPGLGLAARAWSMSSAGLAIPLLPRAAPGATATSQPLNPRKRFPRKHLFSVCADQRKRLFTRYYK